MQGAPSGAICSARYIEQGVCAAVGDLATCEAVQGTQCWCAIERAEVFMFAINKPVRITVDCHCVRREISVSADYIVYDDTRLLHMVLLIYNLHMHE